MHLTTAASWATLLLVVALAGCVWYLVRGSSRRWGR